MKSKKQKQKIWKFQGKRRRCLDCNKLLNNYESVFCDRCLLEELEQEVIFDSEFNCRNVDLAEEDEDENIRYEKRRRR